MKEKKTKKSHHYQYISFSFDKISILLYIIFLDIYPNYFLWKDEFGLQETTLVTLLEEPLQEVHGCWSTSGLNREVTSPSHSCYSNALIYLSFIYVTFDLFLLSFAFLYLMHDNFSILFPFILSVISCMDWFRFQCFTFLAQCVFICVQYFSNL